MDTHITRLAIQYRMVKGSGWLARYFKEKGCIGEMFIGVKTLEEPPPFTYQSALLTGSFRSRQRMDKPKFSLEGWNTSKSKITVDNQVVNENNADKTHSVKVFDGSVHGVSVYMEWNAADKHTGTFKIKEGSAGYNVETKDMYPGMTERDVLRSYLLNMPPTNAFGRAFIAVLLTETDTSAETVAVQKTFAANKKLIQVLTTNWMENEKEAKNYLFDNIMGAIDEKLQIETFKKTVVDKKHYVVADDVRLSEVLKVKEYKDLALGYLGVMAYNSDPKRYNMINKAKINKDMAAMFKSKWAIDETKRISDMLRTKYQPQMAFSQVSPQEVSHYVDDIGAILDTPTFRSTFMKMTTSDQIEAAKAVITVFTALEPKVEKWEPYLRTIMALVSTSHEMSSMESVIAALERDELAFRKALAETLGGIGDAEKEQIVVWSKLFGYSAPAFTEAAEYYIDWFVGQVTSNPNKYRTSKGRQALQQDFDDAVEGFQLKWAQRKSMVKLFAKVAAISGIIAVGFSANFDTPVNSAYFGVSLADAIANASESITSFATYLDDILVKYSKTMQKLHNKILSPLKTVIAKAGSKVASKAAAISANFGKLTANLGKHAGKLLGPTLGVIASAFSFYYAWESFEKGDIVDGALNVVAGVVGVLTGVLAGINAVTGWMPGINAVMAVASLLVLVATLLWTFVLKPKKKHELVRQLKLKGWATSELKEDY